MRKYAGYNWRFNSRYWTSGVKMATGGTFHWCSNKAIIAGNLWGANNGSDGSIANCAQMVIYKHNSTVALEGKNCGLLSALACQV
jgi:hypothetical protein